LAAKLTESKNLLVMAQIVCQNVPKLRLLSASKYRAEQYCGIIFFSTNKPTKSGNDGASRPESRGPEVGTK